MVEQHVLILLLLVICSTQVYIQGKLELLMSVIESLAIALIVSNLSKHCRSILFEGGAWLVVNSNI